MPPLNENFPVKSLASWSHLAPEQVTALTQYRPSSPPYFHSSFPVSPWTTATKTSCLEAGDVTEEKNGGARRKGSGDKNTDQKLLQFSQSNWHKQRLLLDEQPGADGHKHLAKADSGGTGRASTHLFAPPHECSILHVQLCWGEKKYVCF